MREQWNSQCSASGCGWTTTDRERLCLESCDTSEVHTDLDNGHPLLPTLFNECFFVYLLPIKILQPATSHTV